MKSNLVDWLLGILVLSGGLSFWATIGTLGVSLFRGTNVLGTGHLALAFKISALVLIASVLALVLLIGIGKKRNFGKKG